MAVTQIYKIMGEMVMANLKTRLDKLFIMLQANEDTPIIEVWATLPTDKPVDELLLPEYKDLEFEPFVPCKLEPKFEKATTLGELEKLCRKYGYGLFIMPCTDLNDIMHLWDETWIE